MVIAAKDRSGAPNFLETPCLQCRFATLFATHLVGPLHSLGL